jgi:hypothetical protein
MPMKKSESKEVGYVAIDSYGFQQAYFPTLSQVATVRGQGTSPYFVETMAAKVFICSRTQFPPDYEQAVQRTSEVLKLFM